MGFLTDRFNIKNTTYSLNDQAFIDLLGLDSSISSDKLGEAVYFRCLKYLSETMAKLPLKIYQETDHGNKKIDHYLNYLLKTQPNPYMSASTFFSTVEYNRNHYGNAFVWIERNRNNGKVKALWILNNSCEIMVDDKGTFGTKDAIYYVYTDTKTTKRYVLKMNEVLHFKNWITADGEGLVGLSVRNILKSYIDRGLCANEFVTKMTKNGMMTDKIVVQYTGSLDDKAEKALIQHIENFSTNGSGKYITMPLGMNVSNLSSKLVDSQFLELSMYNSIMIAQAFGLSPQHIGDWSKGNFANAGVQQEMFYKDTLLPILKIYEQELAIKLLTQKEKDNGYYFNFNVDAILRAAFKERVDAYAVAISNGIMSPNECRALENRAGLEGGDVLLGNGNLIPIKMAGQQYGKRGDSNE